MRMIKVKPAEGSTVKDDTGKVIPKAGCTLKKSLRIARLIREGDLTDVTLVKTNIISDRKEKK